MMKIREEAFCTNGTGYDCELVLKCIDSNI